METLLRVQLSPVPAHTIFELLGSIVTAPMDCTSGLSKTGLKVLPPLIDFHTPPLAAPANTVSLPFSLTAVTAAMRPLIVADPMFRAGNPETVPESYFTGFCCANVASDSTIKNEPANHMRNFQFIKRRAVISRIPLKSVMKSSGGSCVRGTTDSSAALGPNLSAASVSSSCRQEVQHEFVATPQPARSAS